MTDKAAFFGSYVDAKFMPGLKVMRVSVDVPIEHSNAFLSAFGAPTRADPVPVAIARLATNPAKQPEAPHGAAKLKRSYSRSQLAALKCGDWEFREWMAESGFFPGWAPNRLQSEDTRTQTADAAVKDVLGIKSKAELDSDPEKAAAWDRIMASYEFKDRARQ